MTNLKLSRYAKRDMKQARKWYNQQEPGIGDEFIEHVEEKLGKVVQMPSVYGFFADEFRRAPLNKYPCSIYFRMMGETAQVVAVLHNKRNIHQLLAQRITS